MSGFDYDKLDTLEIQALAIIDVFRVVKVKDLMNMADDPEQISSFLGNAYMSFTILYCYLYVNLLNFFIYFFHLKWWALKWRSRRSWCLKQEQDGEIIYLKDQLV